MTNDVMLFLSKEELEFIKNGMIEACAGMGASTETDYEFVIKLAAKIIQASEENTEENTNVGEGKVKTSPWNVVTTPFVNATGSTAIHS